MSKKLKKGYPESQAKTAMLSRKTWKLEVQVKLELCTKDDLLFQVKKKPNKSPKQYKTSNTKPTNQKTSDFARSSQENQNSPSIAAWSHQSAFS